MVSKKQILTALSPLLALKRGYAVIRHNGQAIRSIKQLKKGMNAGIQLYDGTADANITRINP